MPDSHLKVNTIGGNAGIAVSFPKGLTVQAGTAITSTGIMNVTGTLTAGSYEGDGSGITNLPGANKQKTVALFLTL
jgi:hypothetical protein|tara:strand:- start:447 stop:674 length:228 start_codon:yes stop_codon:yes gene_type:complete